MNPWYVSHASENDAQTSMGICNFIQLGGFALPEVIIEGVIHQPVGCDTPFEFCKVFLGAVNYRFHFRIPPKSGKATFFYATKAKNIPIWISQSLPGRNYSTSEGGGPP